MSLIGGLVERVECVYSLERDVGKPSTLIVPYLKNCTVTWFKVRCTSDKLQSSNKQINYLYTSPKNTCAWVSFREGCDTEGIHQAAKVPFAFQKGEYLFSVSFWTFIYKYIYIFICSCTWIQAVKTRISAKAEAPRPIIMDTLSNWGS